MDIDKMEGDVNDILNKYGAPSWHQRITHTLFRVLREQQAAIERLQAAADTAADESQGGTDDQDSNSE